LVTGGQPSRVTVISYSPVGTVEEMSGVSPVLFSSWLGFAAKQELEVGRSGFHPETARAADKRGGAEIDRMGVADFGRQMDGVVAFEREIDLVAAGGEIRNDRGGPEFRTAIDADDGVWRLGFNHQAAAHGELPNGLQRRLGLRFRLNGHVPLEGPTLLASFRYSSSTSAGTGRSCLSFSASRMVNRRSSQRSFKRCA
jgi:hypothetical protein